MACLACLALSVPGAWSLVARTTARAVEQPTVYALGTLALLGFIAVWSMRRNCTLQRQCGWVAYLLAISIVEEVSFRLVLPEILGVRYPATTAHILSNLVFASLHYITLRWRAVNCVATFFGGMGLSYLMREGDLVLVIMVHWLGTFLNTPAPPGEGEAPATGSPAG